MNDLAGNPFEKDAKGHSVDASENTGRRVEDRLVFAQLSVAHATLALAYEQRTANLIAELQNPIQDVSDWPPQKIESWTKQAIEISKRLGMGTTK